MVRCFNCQFENSDQEPVCKICHQTLLLRSGNKTYRLEHVLGKGGFGIVYRARDSSGNLWAIKENTEQGTEAWQQFEREADVLSVLSHGNLAAVVDYIVDPPTNGRQYIVMEYVPGQDLTEWIGKHGPPTEQRALQWMNQILNAVDYLHTRPRPVIHRDIKPDNIRLLPDEQTVKLVDFGIIKIGGAHRKTQKAAQGATPGYSPAEQYGGSGTGPFSDVYSLGATFYTMLSCETPADAIDRAHAGITLKPLRRINPQVSPRLEQIIHKAMAIDATYRYQTAGEMLRALGGTAIPVDESKAQSQLTPISSSGTGQPPPPVESLEIDSNLTGSGDWINTLQWIPHKGSKIKYIVLRKYHTQPATPQDGQVLASVIHPTYEDHNPEVGLPTFYAVYAVHGGVISETGAIRQANMRLAEVTNLQAAREGKNKVRLTWNLPPNVYDVIVRSSAYEAPLSQHHGDPVSLQNRICDSVVDKNASQKSQMHYAVFCRFRDDSAGVWRTSKGKTKSV